MVLSFVLFRMRSHYYTLTSRTRKKNIDEILDTLIKQLETVSKNQVELKKELNTVQSQLSQSYQKIGLVRFHAFGKAEGEQSFVIALLNGQNNGIVINFIYIHDTMRIYSKLIENGKGHEHELSNEEKEAILRAK